MEFEFTKMHGLGNDFVVIDAVRQNIALNRKQIQFIANRHFGIGCDQVLLVEAPRHPETDFYYRIYNSDGGEVQQCGNGARCLARFIHDQGLSNKQRLRVETISGIIEPVLQADGQVMVDMGQPDFMPDSLPFQGQTIADHYQLDINGQMVRFGAVSMGNPHAVIQVEDTATAPVDVIGPALQQHAAFPQSVNVGFMQVLSRAHIRLRVYERGAGETLACGTGACAAVAVGRQQGLLDAMVSVELTGGTLHIQWDGGDEHVAMTGPATRVYKGQITL